MHSNQQIPEDKYHRIWGRFTLWIGNHQPISRLVVILIGLFLFLLLLPPYMRDYFWNGLQSHKILAGMLLFFCLLGISLVWTRGQQFDAWAFLIINIKGQRPIWLDRVMLGFTQIGSGIGVLVLVMILYLTRNSVLAYEFIFGTLTLWGIVEVLKLLVHRSRPFIRLTQTRIVGFRASGQSFPSGHTSQVFFLATLLARSFHLSIWLILLLYAVAFLVGITRMYVGAHYPRDVLAGAILGTGWGLLGLNVNSYLLDSSN